MIPKAWYSKIELRLILARRPCCIPRSKRRITTLGEGLGSSSEIGGKEQRIENTYYLCLDLHGSDRKPRNDDAV